MCVCVYTYICVCMGVCIYRYIRLYDVSARQLFHIPFHTQTCMCHAAQSCPTLCNPMDCSLSGSAAHGIFQARILEIAISFSRGSSQPRD